MSETRETHKDLKKGTRADIGHPPRSADGPHAHPSVDILNMPEEILVRADLPGVNAQDVDVRFENGLLTLSGSVQMRAPAKGGFLIQEYEPLDFFRRFAVGEGVQQDRISAEYESGVLTLHLPKVESARSRKIEIRQSQGK